MRYKYFICLAIIFATTAVQAQYQELIRISTDKNMLLLGVDGNKKLQQISYGGLVPDEDTIRFTGFNTGEAYPAFGTNVTNTGLRITHSDGNMTTDLVYAGKQVITVNTNTTLTEIILKDSYYPLQVHIFYRAFRQENIIEQWVEIKHQEKGAVMLYDATSANLLANAHDYFLTYFNGDWSDECNMYETRLQPGTMVLNSKEGVRTAQKISPSFLLSLNNKLAEESGQVIGATLAWPGNWQMQFNVDNAKRLHVMAGINPYAGNYLLAADTVFRSPALIYTFSDAGAGEVTRRFHRWARNYGIHNGHGDRDVVLNNWETTGMDFDEQKLTGLISEGGNLGFDLFLLDDGWFGNKYPRNTDQAGLGDWQVNKSKLPHGLGYLVKESNQNHLKFGIWVEPEMVNPKSELYEQHPGWALSAPHRPLDEQRNQLILDLSNPEVQNYIYTVLYKLLTENPGITYIKWDCNRFLTNAWSSYEGRDKQSNLYTDYAWGFLHLLDRFRHQFPHITMMLCASGGGRMDYGSMHFFDEYWPSDNTNGHDRVKIQWGMTYFFPAIGFAAHVSEMGRQSALKFRFDVGMAGKLGMDMQLSHLNADEKAFAKNAIKTYKEIKDIVLYGDLYRLLSPYEYDRTALMYVTEDKKRALLFTYQLQKGNGGDFTTIFPKGLKPAAKYKMTEINKGSYSRFGDYEGKVYTGSYLMQYGLKFAFWNAEESTVVLLTEQ